MIHCDCIDYPASEIFHAYHFHLYHLPALETIEGIDYGEGYFMSARVIRVLQAMGVIRVFDKPKLKGVRL